MKGRRNRVQSVESIYNYQSRKSLKGKVCNSILLFEPRQGCLTSLLKINLYTQALTVILE